MKRIRLVVVLPIVAVSQMLGVCKTTAECVKTPENDSAVIYVEKRLNDEG